MSHLSNWCPTRKLFSPLLACGISCLPAAASACQPVKSFAPFGMADWFDSYQQMMRALCAAALCLNSWAACCCCRAAAACFSYIETIIKTSSQRIVQCAATTRPTILWLIQSSLNDVGTTILLFTFPFKKPSMLSELQVSTGFRHCMHCSRGAWQRCSCVVPCRNCHKA